MRRGALIASIVVGAVGVAGVAVWVAKRTIRWNDARMMPPPLEAAVRAFSRDDGDAGLRHVDTFLLRYRAPAWEGRARILAATHLARAGRDAEILRVLPRELPESDALAPEGLTLRARGLLARSDAGGAADCARRAAEIRSFPRAAEARRVLVDALDAAGRWKEALTVLDASRSAGDAIAGARLAAKHADAEGARRRLVEALLAPAAADDAPALIAAIDGLPSAAPRFTAGERPKLAAVGRGYLEDGSPQMAADVVRLARPAGAPSAATPAEALVEAEALLRLGRISEARTALMRARQGDAATRDGARYMDARIDAEQGRYAGFRAGLSALSQRGASPWRQRALLDLARAVEGVPSLATLEAYRRYRAAAGDGADPLALLREAWAAFELGRTSEAEAGFSRAMARREAPGGVRVTALYWRARIAEAAGRSSHARELFAQVVDEFPNHYYGMLAAQRIGASRPAAAPDPEPLKDLTALGESKRWLIAGRQLASVGLWDDASPFYRAALDGAAGGRMAIAVEAASAARQAASLSDAVSFAQRAVGDRDRARPETVPLSLWRLLVPAPSAQAITRAAQENGFEPSLVAAVALQESAFNPLAVSSAGARGLLQVMPAVGRELAGRLRLKGFDANDLFDPEVNLRLGCAHLKDYVRRFGSLPPGLAAYNGGPTRVARWTSPRPKDDERFVERIPIPETRLYVKRVLTGARLYAIAWPAGLGVE